VRCEMSDVRFRISDFGSFGAVILYVHSGCHCEEDSVASSGRHCERNVVKRSNPMNLAPPLLRSGDRAFIMAVIASEVKRNEAIP
jgi:hypothetical protein